MKVLEREDADCYEHLAVCHRSIDPTGLPDGPLLLLRLDQRFRTRTGMKSCLFGTITISPQRSKDTAATRHVLSAFAKGFLPYQERL